MLPDEDVDAAAVVLPMKSLSVVSAPGVVKIVHRSGRVIWTFSGASMLDDMRDVRDGLDEFCGEGMDARRRLAREVQLAPWWKRLWPW